MEGLIFGILRYYRTRPLYRKQGGTGQFRVFVRNACFLHIAWWLICSFAVTKY